MMKKTMYICALAALTAYEAKALEVQPYVGVDYVYSLAKIKPSKYTDKHFQALNISVGNMITSTIGLELSYQQALQNKKNTLFGRTKTEYKVYALDGVYYYSLSENLQALFAGGAGYYETKSKIQTGVAYLHEDDGHYGLRAGLGAQYNINANISARLMMRYHYIRAKHIKNMEDITIGARYYF